MDFLNGILGGLIGGGAAFAALKYLLGTLISKQLDYEYASRLEGQKASLQQEGDTQLETVKASLQRAGNSELEKLKASLQEQGSTQLENLKASLQLEYGSRLERLKQDLATASQYDLQVLTPRLEAYRALWALTGRFALSATPTPTSVDCHALEAELRAWYYEKGNGIFLSLRAAELFLRAKARLGKAEADVNGAREDLSALRTQLKGDLRVYDEIEAGTELAITG